MSNISLSNFDSSKYKDISQKMSGITFLFEGKVNKKYYQKIPFFRPFTLDNGGSCSNIINKVSTSLTENIHGVIDGDFERKDIQRIYQIDYYSIENICLIYNDQFKELREIITNYYPSHTKYKRIVANINSGSFTLEADNDIESIFHDYIDEISINVEIFMRYMDLKEVVDSYSRYRIKQNNTSKNSPPLSGLDRDNVKAENKFFKKYIENAVTIVMEQLFKEEDFVRLKQIV